MLLRKILQTLPSGNFSDWSKGTRYENDVCVYSRTTKLSCYICIMLGKSTEKGNNARLFFCSSCVPLAATQQTQILSQSSPPIVLQSAYTFHPFLISLLYGIQYTVHTEECKKVVAHRRF